MQRPNYQPPPQGNYSASSYPPAQQQGYPPSQQPNYPGSQQPRYPGSQQPGYPGNPQSQQPGHHSSQQPGYQPSQQPGYPPSQQPGYPPSQQPGYQPTSQPPAQQPGYQPTGYPPSQPSSQQPGYQPAQPTGYPPSQPQSQQPVYAPQGSVAGSYGGNVSQQSNLPPPSTRCTSKIEIRITCKNLLNKDITSKSDPMVALSIKQGNKWYEAGRTENIKNCLNPEFSKPIKMDYFFEEIQQAKFDVYDIDNTTPALNDDDFLGFIECNIGEIVSSKCISKYLKLRNGSRAGKGLITISVEEVQEAKDEIITLRFSAKGLDKKDFFGKSDPYLEIRRQLPNGSMQLSHRTEVIKNNLNPQWRQMQINKSALCGTNPEQEIKISCYDYDDDGSHDFIGECTTSLIQMMECTKQAVTWTLQNAKKLAKKGKSYKGSGTLILQTCQVLKVHSFLDFITTGTKLNFIVAVDFTASNGDPAQPNSLHHIDPYRPNEYQQAISAVGSVLQDYDSDRMFPALGFGAMVPPQYNLSHEFALNFDLSNPFCSGVDGLLQAYSNCLRQVRLYGPTNFSPVINHAINYANHAHQQAQPNEYFVLLILTDGVITDMDNTRNAIVNASKFPLSIIIVGVGGANFQAMDFLDGDGQALRATNGAYAARDIVQFVPFRKYGGNHALVSREVLAEIPTQLTQYYRARKISPNTKEIK